jgi:hypothetical protein
MSCAAYITNEVSQRFKINYNFIMATTKEETKEKAHSICDAYVNFILI